MQVIYDDETLPADSYVALIKAGSHSLGGYKLGTLFRITDGILGGRNFSLTAINSDVTHSGIGRTFSILEFRFRHPYKNEVKLCK